jgi:nitroreductase
MGVGRIKNAIRRRVRKLYRILDGPISRLCVKTGFGSSFYYCFWNGSFQREHRAVLQGRLNFVTTKGRASDSSSLLRRNTHRLEKGILSRPRRSVFAVDYIEETVDNYVRAVILHVDGPGQDDVELQWATDVLGEYFNVTDKSDKTINEMRLRYNAVSEKSFAEMPERSEKRAPYIRDLSPAPSVSFDSFLALALRRRSVRWFNGQPVPRSLIEKAVTAARQSPSACNRQPFEFRVFDDPEILKYVAALPAGTAGFSQNFPCIIVVLGRQGNYFDERDRHLVYIDGALAAMGFIYALETLGLASCCINWPDIKERELEASKILNLAVDERPVMFLAVGYPDEDGLVAYSEKKPIGQLCKYNFE